MADNFNNWMRYQTEDVVERLKDNGDDVHAAIVESMTNSGYIDSSKLGYLVTTLMNSLHDEYVDEAENNDED